MYFAIQKRILKDLVSLCIFNIVGLLLVTTFFISKILKLSHNKYSLGYILPIKKIMRPNVGFKRLELSLSGGAHAFHVLSASTPHTQTLSTLTAD